MSRCESDRWASADAVLAVRRPSHAVSSAASAEHGRAGCAARHTQGRAAVIALVTVLAALILAVAAAVVVLVAATGARREPDRRLPVRATCPRARLARRILGLHVRRPSADVPELRRQSVGVAERR